MTTYARIRPFLVAIVSGAVAALVLGIAWAVFATRDTQTKNSPLIARIDSLTAQINDCVDPDGKCYQDGQERTAKAVGDIGQLQVRAIACAIAATQDQTTAELTAGQLATRIEVCLTRLADTPN